jgi:hypothetical protein
MSAGRARRGEGANGAQTILEALRTAVVLSGLVAGLAIALLAVYVAYVYSLWVHAMRAEGAPGAPPP